MPRCSEGLCCHVGSPTRCSCAVGECGGKALSRGRQKPPVAAAAEAAILVVQKHACLRETADWTSGQHGLCSCLRAWLSLCSALQQGTTSELCSTWSKTFFACPLPEISHDAHGRSTTASSATCCDIIGDICIIFHLPECDTSRQRQPSVQGRSSDTDNTFGEGPSQTICMQLVVLEDICAYLMKYICLVAVVGQELICCFWCAYNQRMVT